MSPHHLDALADALIDEYSGTVGATLIRLVQCDDPEEVEFGIRPLDGHPADELAGFRAPESWVAIGIITGGWAAPMDGIRPSAHPDAVRITQLVIVDRDGTVLSRVRRPDGSTWREPPSSGAVLDALLTSLGLPATA